MLPLSLKRELEKFAEQREDLRPQIDDILFLINLAYQPEFRYSKRNAFPFVKNPGLQVTNLQLETIDNEITLDEILDNLIKAFGETGVSGIFEAGNQTNVNNDYEINSGSIPWIGMTEFGFRKKDFPTFRISSPFTECFFRTTIQNKLEICKILGYNNKRKASHPKLIFDFIKLIKNLFNSYAIVYGKVAVTRDAKYAWLPESEKRFENTNVIWNGIKVNRLARLYKKLGGVFVTTDFEDGLGIAFYRDQHLARATHGETIFKDVNSQFNIYSNL